MEKEETFENMDEIKRTSKENIATVIREETRKKSNAQLQEWYTNFIKSFREEFSTLSEEEKSCLDNTNNFLNPCQIEVFWIANPSLQLIILSNLPDRKDMKIHINGPFTTNEFRDKVNLILQEPRWNQTISEPFQVDLGSNHQYTYAERLASQIHQFMEYSKYLLFNLVPFSGPGGGNALN
ncbi:hypothetical protein JYT57_01520, partial [Nitrosarchaeum koreense]|nr:hypothetical protein [Nitrosarchaeum koreense]